MHCPDCNSSIDDEVEFCPICGFSILKYKKRQDLLGRISEGTEKFIIKFGNCNFKNLTQFNTDKWEDKEYEKYKELVDYIIDNKIIEKISSACEQLDSKDLNVSEFEKLNDNTREVLEKNGFTTIKNFIDTLLTIRKKQHDIDVKYAIFKAQKKVDEGYYQSAYNTLNPYSNVAEVSQMIKNIQPLIAKEEARIAQKEREDKLKSYAKKVDSIDDISEMEIYQLNAIIIELRDYKEKLLSLGSFNYSDKCDKLINAAIKRKEELLEEEKRIQQKKKKNKIIFKILIICSIVFSIILAVIIVFSVKSCNDNNNLKQAEIEMSILAPTVVGNSYTNTTKVGINDYKKTYKFTTSTSGIYLWTLGDDSGSSYFVYHFEAKKDGKVYLFIKYEGSNYDYFQAGFWIENNFIIGLQIDYKTYYRE